MQVPAALQMALPLAKQALRQALPLLPQAPQVMQVPAALQMERQALVWVRQVLKANQVLGVLRTVRQELARALQVLEVLLVPATLAPLLVLLTLLRLMCASLEPTLESCHSMWRRLSTMWWLHSPQRFSRFPA
jgi:hypothetical protein